MNTGPALVLAIVVVPLAAGGLLLADAARGARAGPLAGAALVLEFVLAALAVKVAAAGQPVIVHFASSPGTTGAALVLDRLAALLLLATAAVGCVAAGYGAGARAGARARRDALLQFQLAGLALAFLTSNLGCLFLALEAVVFGACASIAASAGARRARATRDLLLANIGAAVLFATALACILRAVGTLDLAELGNAAPAAPAAAAQALTVAAFLLLAVFTFVAVALPVALWWPPAYAAAPAPVRLVAVLFVAAGVYALLRIYPLAFPCFGAGACGPSGAVLPVGLATLAGAALAVFCASVLREQVAFLLAVSAGTALVALGAFRVDGLAAAIYLIAHGTLAAVGLCVAADLLARTERATAAVAGGATVGAGRSAVLYGAALFAIVGLPPAPAFVGIVAMLRAAGPAALTVWTLLLTSMLLVIGSIARERRPADAAIASTPPGRAATAVAVLAVGASFALTLAAGPVFDYAAAAARQLLDRSAYVAAVQASGGGAHAALKAASPAPR